MLLPNNMRPEDSIYYNGAIVLKVLQTEKKISVMDLYCRLREQYKMSFAILQLCIDWLYLIDCIIVKNGDVDLCS